MSLNENIDNNQYFVCDLEKNHRRMTIEKILTVGIDYASKAS